MWPMKRILQRLLQCRSSTTLKSNQKFEAAPEQVNEFASLEEAQKLLNVFKKKYRSQAIQLMACRWSLKKHEKLVKHLQQENANQLKTISSKLRLFESRLARKQKYISALLQNKDRVIFQLQQIIELFRITLMENGVPVPKTDVYSFTDLDFDSADFMDEDKEEEVDIRFDKRFL